ncbi:MAG: GNAT family N-acetyltransferase [Bacilli bacterium]|nr:GNAT family N-acetyltransferase [Bacilli bacterium]
MIHYEPITIDTSKMTIRRAKQSDAKDMFHHWSSSAAVTRYLSWTPHENVGATELMLSLWRDGVREAKMTYWMCELKSIQKVIGSITLMMMNEKEAIGEVGFCYGESFWSQGIATEVLNALLKYAFELGYHAIICRTRRENVACIRVLEKCHMKYEKTVSVLWLKDHEHHEIDTYKITKKEFELSTPS